MNTGRPLLRRAPVILALVALSAAAETVTVEIQNYSYIPAEVRIRIGDTVRWINKEKRTSHSILFPAEGGLESERIFPEETWQRSFPKAGSYPYTCGPHPEMKGLVVVSE
ncbi:MAG: cupredoxin domain-containing protein [Azonexus sp.]|nr:cupredoxin domain-containing protein [Betaproteobacteria bacterium]MBP6034737.1 cupredoxin domain-containing protein [Azonexus sp.]MBP6905277.1 cupredoxin domain-containing protein [Azonexus sp.]